MFYSEVILARKGPLGKIWLAAHFDKKLTRNQIFTTDISSSVESILNPTSPLALRVSGHLMLGIVRIYSRKVNYLMTECKEAMWKINLAFRPGTFDIDPNFASTLNINDARHFGNIDMENELPGLENTEFPHVLLPEQDHLRMDLHADVSFHGHTLEDYSLSAESPQVRPGARSSRGVSGSGSRLSRVSDLELTRFERGASLSSQLPRASMSSAREGRPSVSIAMGFEDDIPAFQEGGFEGYPLEPVGMLDFGDYVPPFEDEQATVREVVELSELRREGRASARVLAMQARQEQEGELEEQELEQGGVSAAAQQQPGAAAAAAATRKRKVAKRRRVVIDDRVELPARLLKQRMEDLAPIMRQRGTDALARCPPTSTTGPSSGIHGLCAELQDVFNMSINAIHMPFPLKEGVAPAAPAAAAGPSEEAREGQVGADTGTYDEVEFTRAPRDSDVLSAAAGRLSVLQASSVGGKEGDSFAVMEEEARFSLGSRGQTSYAEGGDFGEFGGYDDYVPAFEAPLSFRASSPGAGGRGMEESKAAGSAEARTRARLPTLLASNSLSELVASTFSRSAAEQAGEGSAAASRASGSRDSASHHTRTEQFMDILSSEFEKQPTLSFEKVTSGVTKRVAAAAFLEVLQLKTWGRIDATQPAPFVDITLAPSHVGAM